MFALPLLLVSVYFAHFHGSVTAVAPETIVYWYEEETTIFQRDSPAILTIFLSKLSPEDITVSLRAFGVGLSVVTDIAVQENVTLFAGQRYADVAVFINPDVWNDKASVSGNLLVRIRLQEVLEGRANLGGYHYPEIADIHLLGPSTTECHSGAFRHSRISVPEDVGTIHIPFQINSPLKDDHQIGYQIDLQWTGASSHARHELDYRYHVDHNHVGEDKYVTLAAGESVVYIPVTIIDDSEAEETEQFIVRLDHKCLHSFINILNDYIIVDIVDNDVCSGIPLSWLYEYYQGYCYFALELHARGSFSDGEKACRKYGGDLLSIANEIINGVAYQLLPFDETAWIGAHRDPSNSTQFIWPDGSPVVYHSWAIGEPAHYESGEDCVTTHHREMQAVEWSTEYCGGMPKISWVICQKRAVKPDN